MIMYFYGYIEVYEYDTYMHLHYLTFARQKKLTFRFLYVYSFIEKIEIDIWALYIE